MKFVKTADQETLWPGALVSAGAAILLALSPINATAQLSGSAPFSSAGTTAEAVTDFLKRLQSAVAADRRKEVAGLVQYPVPAWTGKKTVNLRSQKELLANYDAIFTPQLKASIAAAKVENSWANWQGVMWEQGRFWLRVTDPGETLRLGTINQPATAQ